MPPKNETKCKKSVKVKAEKLDCPLVIVAVARTIHVNYKSNLAPPCECETPCRRYSAFLKRGTKAPQLLTKLSRKVPPEREAAWQERRTHVTTETLTAEHLLELRPPLKFPAKVSSRHVACACGQRWDELPAIAANTKTKANSISKATGSLSTTTNAGIDDDDDHDRQIPVASELTNDSLARGQSRDSLLSFLAGRDQQPISRRCILLSLAPPVDTVSKSIACHRPHGVRPLLPQVQRRCVDWGALPESGPVQNPPPPSSSQDVFFELRRFRRRGCPCRAR